jgi:anti-anti-sigma factor
MLLRVDVLENADHALITAVGEIDVGTAPEVADAVSGALSAGHPHVLLDFSQVTFIDSAGLAALIKAHRQAEAAQARFAVVHPTAQTRKLIRVLGLDQLLLIYDTSEQALADR